VDGQGLAHAVAITTAAVTDHKGALQTRNRCKATLAKVPSLLCDSGYVEQPFKQSVQETLGEHVTVQIAKHSELHTFKIARRFSVLSRWNLSAHALGLGLLDDGIAVT